MSPRPDPLIDQQAPWDHCQQRKVADQLANLFKAVAQLADGLTANTGEIAALRRAVDGSQARAEVNRLNAKRRYAMEKSKCDKSSSS